MVETCLNRIRELREARGLSGTKLAEMVGISPQYLYKLERGEKGLNDKLIAEFTKVLGVSSDYLLRLSDDFHSVQAGDEERSRELDRLLADEEIYLNAGALTVEEKQAILDFIKFVKTSKARCDH